MFQIAHLVMACLDRLKSAFDHRTGFGGELVVLQGVFELGLDMILATLDLGDHCGIVAGGDFGLEVEEGAMGTGQQGAVILGIAAETGDFTTQLFGDLLALDWKISLKRPVSTALADSR